MCDFLLISLLNVESSLTHISLVLHVLIDKNTTVHAGVHPSQQSKVQLFDQVKGDQSNRQEKGLNFKAKVSSSIYYGYAN